ncbi:exodeoxyribonuclease VII small subunit [Orbus sasakiae]|uniref:Exodeoxyribonuclease 7 small subunit n=1 Tax=Orbus sasakiae TaxID=1078475 RepID=A0ABP9N5J7_9GAMM
MAKAQAKATSFEDTLKELENIVSKLEVGNLPLDEALTEFEKGVKLAKQGQVQLQKAEQRIQILLNESSEAPLTDFTDSEN